MLAHSIPTMDYTSTEHIETKQEERHVQNDLYLPAMLGDESCKTRRAEQAVLFQNRNHIMKVN